MEGEKEVIHALSSHEKKEQRRQEREEALSEKETEKEIKQRRKNYFWIGATIVALIAFAAGIGWLYTHKEQTYTDREVHWHALIDLNICGQKTELPCLKETPGIVHGKEFCGVHILHHHYDNIIHIEGLVQKKEDIALGKFFDEIGVPFDSNKILNSTNGDLCQDGKPGTLKMYVNGQPRTDFREYIPFATPDASKQVIKLVFDSNS